MTENVMTQPSDVQPLAPSVETTVLVSKKQPSQIQVSKDVNLFVALKELYQGMSEIAENVHRFFGRETIAGVVIDLNNHTVSFARHAQQYRDKLPWMLFRVCAVNDGECPIDGLPQTKDQLNRKLVKINAPWVEKTGFRLLRMRENTIVIDPIRQRRVA